MASVFTVLTKLQADVSNFTAGMAKAQASLDKLEKAVASTGGKMDKNLTKESNKAASGLGKLKGAFGAAAAAGAAFAGINYVKNAVGAASAFEAEFVGVEQTFGSASKVVKDFAANAAYTAGLSETAALRYAKSFGGFANAAGLAGNAQAEFSTKLVQTAGDLGSFFDLPTEDALFAIQAGLRGEYEPLRRFNILLDETAIKTAAMNEGVYNGTGELTAQQKVLGAQAAILGQLGVAQNDFTNYADTYGNSIKTVNALMQNLSADLGTLLLPSMAKLAQAFIPIIEKLAPLFEKVFTAIIPIIDAFTKALGPVVDAVGPLINAFTPIMELFATMIEQILPPFIAIFAAITPIINDLVKALAPLVNEFLLYLGQMLENYTVPIIEGFAALINTFVIPTIQLLADIIGNYIMPVLSGFAEMFKVGVGPALEEFTNLVNSFLPQVQGAFKTAFDNIGKAVGWAYDTILKPVFGGILDFMRDVLKIDIEATMADIGDAFKNGFEAAQKRYNESKLSFTGEEARFKAIKDAEKLGTTVGDTVTTATAKAIGSGKGAKQSRDAWKELFLGFAEDVKKQSAKLSLEGMGLSAGLIETILGDADWQKIYDKVVKGGQSMATSMQNAFNRTTEGMAELNAKFEEFTEKANDFNKSIKNMFDNFKVLPTVEENLGRFEQQISDLADTAEGKLADALSLGLITQEQNKNLMGLVATHEKAMREIARQRDALDTQLADTLAIKEFGKEFRKSSDELLKSVQPLKYAGEVIGQFEEAVVASMTAVESSIMQAVEAGYMSEELSKSIKSLAATTQTQLRGIAKQRDKLAGEYQQFVEKLNSAKEFRTATRDAVKGYANITSLGTSARTIIKNFGVMVKRTETFRQQLSTLNQMGLNKELYNQILSSGLDAGSATAKALLKGGPKAVAEINNLFGQLDLTAAKVADDTTKVMFDGGETVIQGFMDGILAQDEKLRLEAEKIANTFTAQFQFTLGTADTNIDNMIASIKAQQSTLETTARELATAFNTAFTAAVSTAVAANAPSVKKPIDEAALAAINSKIAIAEAYKGRMQAAGKWAEFAGASAKLDGYYATRQSILNAATGGFIRGAGTNTSDSIPAMLSNGEFVMRAAAVQKFGAGFMSAINSGRVPAFASGGSVGTARIVSGGGNKTVINNTFEINVRTGIGDPAAIGKQVVSAIAAYEKTSGRRIIG